MPVCFHPDSSNAGLQKAVKVAGGDPVEFSSSSSKCLDIALVNNMPDKALQSTERQFWTLLDPASDGILVRLSLYALPDVPRADLGRRHVGALLFQPRQPVGPRYRRPHRHGYRAARRESQGRTLLAGHDQADRMGRPQILTPASGPVWPRTPPCSRWMASPGAAFLRNASGSLNSIGFRSTRSRPMFPRVS